MPRRRKKKRAQSSTMAMTRVPRWFRRGQQRKSGELRVGIKLKRMARKKPAVFERLLKVMRTKPEGGRP